MQTHPDNPPVALSPPGPTWRSRVTRWVFGLKPADKILRQRAEDLLNRLRFGQHLKQGGVYVDIGSGTGHNAVQAARMAWGKDAKFICIDPVMKPTKAVMRRMRRRTECRLQFIRAVGGCLPLPDASADGVTVLFVLHHIPYPVQLSVLAEVQRVLKPGGLLFIWEDTPQDEREFKITEARDRRLNFESRREPHFYRSQSDWLALFAQHGFEPVEQSYFEAHSRWRNEGMTRHTGFVLRYVGAG